LQTGCRRRTEGLNSRNAQLLRGTVRFVFNPKDNRRWTLGSRVGNPNQAIQRADDGECDRNRQANVRMEANGHGNAGVISAGAVQVLQRRR
jgi:hypothetical protein